MTADRFWYDLACAEVFSSHQAAVVSPPEHFSTRKADGPGIPGRLDPVAFVCPAQHDGTSGSAYSYSGFADDQARKAAGRADPAAVDDDGSAVRTSGRAYTGTSIRNIRDIYSLFKNQMPTTSPSIIIYRTSKTLVVVKLHDI